MKDGLILIGIVLAAMLAVGCGGTVVVTATPTATAQSTATPEPTVTAQPTATPEPTATAQSTATPEPTVTAQPTATPEPTVTAQPLTGLTIRERWEALAEAGLVIREEKKFTVSGSPTSGEWVQQDVILFRVPEGLGGWTIEFSNDHQEVPSVYRGMNRSLGGSYESAHNIWVHIMQMSVGKIELWSPSL